jgi:ribosomal protein S18 acetylase RimI-like enzyme
MSPSANSVLRCSPSLRAEALRILHANLPKYLKAGLVQAIEAVRNEEEKAWDGLLVCQRGDLLSAVWAQTLPGHTAVLWPPNAENPAAKQLMRAAGGFLDRHNVAISQVLLESPRENAADSLQSIVKLLSSSGYDWLANLQYLVAEKPLFPATLPSLPLRFESRAGDQPQRLAQMLEQTYVGTWDCPAVEGIRPMDDVLASYRATGRYQKKSWFFVQHQGRDMGTLLLTPHGSGEVWELVYMGIVPTARGQGFGCQMVQQALWQTAQGGGQRLVLAVDESNMPALAMYRRAGLTGWDRRQVYTRLAEGKPLRNVPYPQSSW